jgi:hypothetical protein
VLPGSTVESVPLTRVSQSLLSFIEDLRLLINRAQAAVPLKRLGISVLLGLLMMMLAVGLHAQDPVGLTPGSDDAEDIAKEPSYSPYAGRNFPTQVYWGDTHVHTSS